MKYRNTKTGFVFDTPCTIKAEGWEVLNPQPSVKAEKEEKPARVKKERKHE